MNIMGGNNKIGASILRFTIGFLLLKDFIIAFKNKRYLFDNDGIVSYDRYLNIINHFNLDWIYINFNDPINVDIFCFSGILFSILFSLGLLKRFSAIILFFILFIFKIRNIYLMDGGDNVILVLLPFMAFIESFSFFEEYDKLIYRITIKFRPILDFTNKYFTLSIIIQICIIYFFASIHKLQGELWRNGTALYYILNSYDFKASFLNEYISRYKILIYLLTWTTIIFQFIFPFMIWFKRTRLPIVLLGVLFHIGIFILMRVDNFSFIMIACYAILFKDSEYTKFKQNLNLHGH